MWCCFLIQEVEGLTTVKGLPTVSLPPSIVSILAGLPTVLPWAAAASSWGKMYDLWNRRSSDDLAFMLMLAVNDLVAPVPSTQVCTYLCTVAARKFGTKLTWMRNQYAQQTKYKCSGPQ